MGGDRKPDGPHIRHRKAGIPVDFAVWQVADGTWQMWSCFRKTTAGGRKAERGFFTDGKESIRLTKIGPHWELPWMRILNWEKRQEGYRLPMWLNLVRMTFIFSKPRPTDGMTGRMTKSATGVCPRPASIIPRTPRCSGSTKMKNILSATSPWPLRRSSSTKASTIFLP